MRVPAPFALLLTAFLALPSFSQEPAPSPPLAPPLQALPAAKPAPLNFHDLPPAFLLSGAQVDAAIARGQEFAKKGKPIQDVTKDCTQQPVGVKGEKGKSHESSVTCLSLNGVTYELAAYNAANRYEPLPASVPGGSFPSGIDFDVSLSSVPKVKTRRFGSERRASADDVAVDKFVLTDDRGNVYNPLDTDDASGIQSGTMDFSGVKHIPRQDTTRVDINEQASVYGSDGSSAIGNGTAAGTLTHRWYEAVPWSESHPYYSARYTVRFPLFDGAGQPLIKADVKSITLHIITPNGEKDATFDLAPPKK